MIRVRFAPSPTGKLHAGNARIALMNYLFARKHGGEFMLRMDDTDTERSRPEYAEAIKRDLAWLGIETDIYEAQSNRYPRYTEMQEKLIANGRLYACYETAEELELKRKILLGQNKPPLYDRAALSLTEAQIADYKAEGRKPHYRFKLDSSVMAWHDMAKGKQAFAPDNLSDPVLIRADGNPLFTFTTVVDDIDFAITHIIRGDDHISNTALQVQIFTAMLQAMGKDDFTLPQFAHLPLITNHEGKNFSKRDDAISLEKMREQQGVESLTLAAALIRMGTATAADGTETLASLAENFDPSAYGKAPPRFGLDDIRELNAKILHHTEFDAVRERLAALHSDAVSEEFWQMARQNITYFTEVKDWANICFGEIETQIAAEDKEMLAHAITILPNPITSDNAGAWVKQTGKDTERKGKALFMPLRLALTGLSHGPELRELLPLIGYDRAVERLMESV